MLIGEMIQRRALISPGGVFWSEPRRNITYYTLNQTANQIARAFLAEDLEPGNHVGIAAGNSFEYTAVHFGAAKAGLVLAHINARLTAPEVVGMVEHGDVEVMVFSPVLAGVMAEARQSLPQVRRWVCLPDKDGREAPPAWATPYGDWCERHPGDDPDLSLFAVRPEVPPIFPEAPFQLLYTSGTTGSPKGALLNHRSKIAHGTTHALNLGLLPGDRLLSSLPLYHQFAQWLVLVAVPLAGATVVARAGFDAGSFWEDLRREEITHLPGVPTMLYRLLDHPQAQAQPPPSLRSVVYGAAPIDPERITQLRFQFPGVRLFQGFGQTELGYCLGLSDEDHALHPKSLGRPDLFSEVKLMDEEGREVKPGEVGEIVAKTPYLMNGYHKEPGATAEYFSFGREWGRTGDLATRDEEGYFFLEGRKTDMVISGGVNIYPLEIERVLSTLKDIEDVAVFGVPDAEWGEQILAAVIPKKGSSVTEAQLREHCGRFLASFKIPRDFLVVSELPRTHNGKVKKDMLRKPFLEKPR